MRARLTAAFLAIVLGPLVLGAVFVGISVRTVQDQRTSERLELAASTLSTTISGLCRTALSAATIVATAPESGRTNAINNVLRQKLADGVLVLDQTGGRLAGGGASLSFPANCATAPTKRIGAGTQPGIAASVQLQTADGQPAGTVEAAYVLNKNLLDQLANITSVDVTALSDRGDPGLTTMLAGDPDGVATTVTKALSSPNPLSSQRTATDLIVRAVPPRIGQPLLLGLSTPRPPLESLYGLLILVVLLVIVIAVLVAWRLARATTMPIIEVAGAAERVAAGDLDARVPVRGRDEVGQLASTFNRMTREMQSYTTALTVSRDQLRGNLALLGDTLSSTHDLDRILEVILETAMAATGAQAGVVLLLDRSDGSWPGTLVGRSGQNLSGRGVNPRDLRLALGEGVLGGVAESGEPRHGRVRNPATDLAPVEPRCQTYIAVPFSGSGRGAVGGGGTGRGGEGRLLGVLALYDRLGADDFDDGDLVTLRTFAGQAAVAVENVLLHSEAERLALADPLTDLWNYRYLRVSLKREIERAARFERSLAVLAVDVDRFAGVNEQHGHTVGDAVLAALAHRLRSAVREVDMAFRQGGEAFVLLLPEADSAGAQTAARRICMSLRSTPIVLPASDPTRRPTELSIRVTVSVGVALYPQHGESPEDLLESAEGALVAAKADGRDTWRVAGAARRIQR
jgi:diguanylate cyclase (GGDEF)-like protein